jgi:cell division protein FtsN
MHKWKDKVELSLDNRQIFFLFFGLSVVGCFVFALGVMTGRRFDGGVAGPGTALSDESLALLDPAPPTPENFAFKSGLATPATADVPATRDPSQPIRPEDEVKAERAAASESDAPAVAAAAAAPSTAATAKPPAAKPAANPPAKPADTTLAGASKAAAAPAESALAGDSPKFALQMKAFSRREEAESFAAKLRSNGHDVRVEAEDVRGRTWHRVRMGTFTSWDAALAAKQDFETAEHVIAYVVRQ